MVIGLRSGDICGAYSSESTAPPDPPSRGLARRNLGLGSGVQKFWISVSWVKGEAGVGEGGAREGEGRLTSADIRCFWLGFQLFLRSWGPGGWVATSKNLRGRAVAWITRVQIESQ